MAIKVNKEGQALLRDPLLNKSTAFDAREKEMFKLYGLLPCNTETIEEQLLRCRRAFDAKNTPLEKHIYLRALQDRNEVLFYRFLKDNLSEMLPLIYTPVVGEACQFFHHIYRQPRGLFITYPEYDHMDTVLSEIAATRDIRVIVVTDGERILGLGDQGAGGLGIPIGKLSLYTVCGGIDPAHTLPVILDVGTNNEEKLKDPEYLGWRHTRLTGQTYDDFVDRFMQGVKRYFPNVLLQFEDFAQHHANPLLQRYRDQLCTFNDDIQGTAAVVVAAVIAATKAANSTLTDQRIALLGAGSAGCGISEQLVQAMINNGLSESEARSRFYLVDKQGLLQESQQHLLPFQQKFAHSSHSLKDWNVQNPQHISLLEVIQNAKPTILLGVSAQPNQFTETIVRTMSSYCSQPIIFPLSNPTSKVEATPADLLRWTDGKALIATGSPFEPVTMDNKEIEIAQCNNSYIFPGIGLGVVAGNIRRISDQMMMAAALALSAQAPIYASELGALLPDLSNIRDVSKAIGKAFILQAIEEGHAEKMTEDEIDVALTNNMWIPEYQPFTI